MSAFGSFDSGKQLLRPTQLSTTEQTTRGISALTWRMLRLVLEHLDKLLAFDVVVGLKIANLSF
jgi:hypothetical protein